MANAIAVLEEDRLGSTGCRCRRPRLNAVDVRGNDALVAEKPELVTKADALMKQARVEDPNWLLRDRPAGKKKREKK